MTAVKFEDRMKEERKYYLGYADKVPGRTQSVADARAEYQALLKKQEKKEAERRAVVLGELPVETFTTSVANGAIVEVERRPFSDAGAPFATSVMPGTAEGGEVTKEELMKHNKADLANIALEDHGRMVSDTAKKSEIVDAILDDSPAT